MQVLVVNVGSNSLKLRVLGHDDEVLFSEDVDPWQLDERDLLADLLHRAADVDAVGHRIVHGGDELRDPAVIDDAVEAAIERQTSLAPIHQPRALAAVRVARDVLPDVPHIACFDTGFHTTTSDSAAAYALPAAWRQRWPIRRYGFHGLSHQWAVDHAAVVAARPEDAPRIRRIISCHLGGGGSLCAALDGRSVDTTMGFTPLEGLVMMTRSGSIDPGLLLWLITEGGLSVEDVAHGLEHDSGLRGLTGTSGDIREVMKARTDGDPDASAGYDIYVHHLRRWIGAMAASLGGVDVLVFTGGLAEHSPQVRADTIDGLGFLGLALDHERNAVSVSDRDISAPDAVANTIVVTSREDLVVAAHVRMRCIRG
jgi:acetate kinase